tara:strand:- start:371 stop:790 length:420 start_codon:yes stop_codon:yes gene_type:complete
MLTKKTKNRIFFLSLVFTLFVISAYFLLSTLRNNLLYFKTPTEIYKSEDIISGTKMRVGGIVKKDSIIQTRKNIKFIITDLEYEIIVTYSGTVPNLFLEEKGVIAEGKLNDKKFLEANRILAKHDENYKPPISKKINND